MRKNIIIPALVMVAVTSIALGLYYSNALSWKILWATVPVALLTAAIAQAQHEYKSHKETTKAVSKVSVWIYMALTIIPYIWVPICTFVGLMPLSTIIIFLTLPVAIACTRTMRNFRDGNTEIIADLGDRTGNLQIMYSLLLTLSFIIG